MIIRNTTVEMEKRSETDTPVPMDARSMNRAMGSVLRLSALFADMQAVRSGGDLTNVGGTDKYVKDYVCPDGCVCFWMTAVKTGKENFYKGNFIEG